MNRQTDNAGWVRGTELQRRDTQQTARNRETLELYKARAASKRRKELAAVAGVYVMLAALAVFVAWRAGWV